MAANPPSAQRTMAYQRFRRLLLLHKVPFDTRLREAEWANRLCVNRHALREAFARLAAEGFLSEGEKLGYFVPTLNEADHREITEIRLALEGIAIERICQIGPGACSGLEAAFEACDQLERLTQEGYWAGVDEADRRFHEALVDASGSRRLSVVYQRAPLPISLDEIIDEEEFTASLCQTVREHRAILAAIREGDAVEAQRLLRIHLLPRQEAPREKATEGCTHNGRRSGRMEYAGK